MDIKTLNNVRFTPKGDTEANWNKAVGFIPLDREVIIYKPDENHPDPRIKIGDGVTVVQNLPFFGTDRQTIQEIVGELEETVFETTNNLQTQVTEIKDLVDKVPKLFYVDSLPPHFSEGTWHIPEEFRQSGAKVGDQVIFSNNELHKVTSFRESLSPTISRDILVTEPITRLDGSNFWVSDETLLAANNDVCLYSGNLLEKLSTGDIIFNPESGNLWKVAYKYLSGWTLNLVNVINTGASSVISTTINSEFFNSLY